MYKILVSDPISPEGLKSLIDHNDFEVVIDTELDEAELINQIADYQALIVRSQTQVTEAIIEAAPNLKVIARAGVGVDNIDVDAATKHGVIVINAPDGNTISATEHSMAMILSMARNIPQAHQSLKNASGIVRHIAELNFTIKRLASLVPVELVWVSLNVHKALGCTF